MKSRVGSKLGQIPIGAEALAALEDVKKIPIYL